MRNNIFFAVILTLLLGFTSCEDYNGNGIDDASVFKLILPTNNSSDVVTGPFGHKYKRYFNGEIDGNSIEFTASKFGAEFYFAVISDLDWKVVSCPEWVKLDAQSIGSTINNFNKEVRLSIPLNRGASRADYVVLSNGTINCMVEVEQGEGGDKFTNEKNTICFNYDGGEVEYVISDISGYTVKCDYSWLTATKSGNSLLIKCKANTEKKNRNGNVVMSNGNSTYAVSFHQLSYPDGFENGHAYVTLNGTNFSTCNLGASKPEERGYLFAWGETNVKNEYSRATYKYWDGRSYTKYTGLGKNGELDANDDAATVAWGDKWCTSGYTYSAIHKYYAMMNEVAGYIWEYNSKSIFIANFEYWSRNYSNSSSYYRDYDDYYNEAYSFTGQGSYNEEYRYKGKRIRPVYINK